MLLTYKLSSPDPSLRIIFQIILTQLFKRLPQRTLIFWCTSLLHIMGALIWKGKNFKCMSRNVWILLMVLVTSWNIFVQVKGTARVSSESEPFLCCIQKVLTGMISSGIQSGELKQRTLASRIVTFAQIHPSYHPDTNKSQLKQTLKTKQVVKTSWPVCSKLFQVYCSIGFYI